MEMAAASELHLTETNQEHGSVCCDCREDPKSGHRRGNSKDTSPQYKNVM